MKVPEVMSTLPEELIGNFPGGTHTGLRVGPLTSFSLRKVILSDFDIQQISIGFSFKKYVFPLVHYLFLRRLSYNLVFQKMTKPFHQLQQAPYFVSCLAHTLLMLCFKGSMSLAFFKH